MSKSVLTIHKEYIKAEYAKSPLGKLEKKLRAFYDKINLKQITLTQAEIDAINKIRTENEEWNTAYIERTEKEQREAVDAKLLEAFTAELKILEANTSTAKQNID